MYSMSYRVYYREKASNLLCYTFLILLNIWFNAVTTCITCVFPSLQIMDQKRAERRQLKKQSRDNMSQDNSSSNPPTVVVTRCVCVFVCACV